MSSSDRPRNTSSPPRPESPPAAAAVPATQDPYANWLDRMQRARARHAAITKNLHTWANYKTWTEQVKDSWEDESKEKK